MNHEPIQFLPVKKFWSEPSAKQRTTRAVCLGYIAGTVATVIVACALIHFLR